MRNLITKEKEKRIIRELQKLAPYNDTVKKLLKKYKNERSFSPAEQKEIFYNLTSARNRELISKEGQKKLRKTVVAFFGLSVGSHAAISWMMESRAEVIKINDFDTIDATNLNRLSYGWDELGRLKTEALSERLKKINPYGTIVSSEDITQKNLIRILKGAPRTSVIVEATDDMEAKIFLRRMAKEMKIPLISGADVGDNMVLDIERYDIDPFTKPFLGRISGYEDIDWKNLSETEKKKMIIKLVGFEKNSEEMLSSLMSIAKTIPTWPQLGATASIAGGVIATAIKKMVLGENVQTGRYYICLDEILVEGFNSGARKERRENMIKEITQEKGLRHLFMKALHLGRNILISLIVFSLLLLIILLTS